MIGCKVWPISVPRTLWESLAKPRSPTKKDLQQALGDDSDHERQTAACEGFLTLGLMGFRVGVQGSPCVVLMMLDSGFYVLACLCSGFVCRFKQYCQCQGLDAALMKLGN